MEIPKELAKKALDMLNTIGDAANTTKEFVVAEAPQVIQEIIHWHIAENILIILIGVLFIVSMFIFKKWYGISSKNQEDARTSSNRDGWCTAKIISAMK